jgi:hypothetical protein
MPVRLSVAPIVTVSESPPPPVLEGLDEPALTSAPQAETNRAAARDTGSKARRSNEASMGTITFRQNGFRAP